MTKREFMMLLEAELQAIAKLAEEAGVAAEERVDMGRRFDRIRMKTLRFLSSGLSEDAQCDGLRHLSYMRSTVAALLMRPS
jgi:hypothetical protein